MVELNKPLLNAARWPFVRKAEELGNSIRLKVDVNYGRHFEPPPHTTTYKPKVSDFTSCKPKLSAFTSYKPKVSAFTSYKPKDSNNASCKFTTTGRQAIFEWQFVNQSTNWRFVGSHSIATTSFEWYLASGIGSSSEVDSLRAKSHNCKPICWPLKKWLNTLIWRTRARNKRA